MVRPYRNDSSDSLVSSKGSSKEINHNEIIDETNVIEGRSLNMKHYWKNRNHNEDMNSKEVSPLASILGLEPNEMVILSGKKKSCQLQNTSWH